MAGFVGICRTFADIDELINDTGYKPGVSIEEGLSEFVGWYKAELNKSDVEMRTRLSD